MSKESKKNIKINQKLNLKFIKKINTVTWTIIVVWAIYAGIGIGLSYYTNGHFFTYVFIKQNIWLLILINLAWIGYFIHNFRATYSRNPGIPKIILYMFLLAGFNWFTISFNFSLEVLLGKSHFATSFFNFFIFNMIIAGIIMSRGDIESSNSLQKLVNNSSVYLNSNRALMISLAVVTALVSLQAGSFVFILSGLAILDYALVAKLLLRSTTP